MLFGGIRIKPVHTTEYYTAENGDHVSLTIFPDNTARLFICKPVNNRVAYKGDYKTRAGAAIAMGRRCGKCKLTSIAVVHAPERED